MAASLVPFFGGPGHDADHRPQAQLTRQSAARARLIEEPDRTREELAQVSREAGRLAERERLATDIHDTLAQGLTGIITLLQAAEPDIALAVQTAKENLTETRALIAAATPPTLENSSLQEALRRLVSGLDVPVRINVSGQVRRLPMEVETALVRVAQESLSNIRKHAEAASAELCLTYDEESVRLALSDDGRGFVPSEDGDGYGLRGMRNRLGRLGGAFSVRSAPGSGTTIVVEVPCSAS